MYSMKYILNLIYKFLYRKGLFVKQVLSKISNNEGGQIYSQTLRDHYKKTYNISIGLYTYVGIFSPSSIANGTSIGRYCSIAPNIHIFSRNHPYKRISQHSFFYNPALSFVEKDNIKTTSLMISHDVWIG